MLKFREATRDRDGVRPSGAGRCVRQQAYAHNGEPMLPHPNLPALKGKISFAQGSAVHQVLQDSVLGIRRVEGEVVLRVAGRIISGHIDGIVRCDDGVERLLEVKTMHSVGFRRFVSGGVDDETYLVQAHLYLFGLQLQGEEVAEVIFVAVNKDSGELAYWVDTYKPELAQRGLRNMELALTQPPSELPRLEATGTELPWQCAYCSYWSSCWPNAAPFGSKVALVLLEDQ